MPDADERGVAFDRYLIRLVDQLWDYRARAYGADEGLFDGPRRQAARPPVFRAEAADRNVLVPPEADPVTASRIRRAIPQGERHRWFGSMRSSQALAQTVFANLQASGELAALAEWTDDEGLPVFPDGARGEMHLEQTIGHLREPRPTQVDVWFEGSTRVAVECKLTEAEVGSCSRPRRPPADPGHCDGTYHRQQDRAARCTLTEIGVAYWDFIPRLLRWPADRDLAPCPLHHTYQLARNLLAACVTPDGTTRPRPRTGGTALRRPQPCPPRRRCRGQGVGTGQGGSPLPRGAATLLLAALPRRPPPAGNGHLVAPSPRRQVRARRQHRLTTRPSGLGLSDGPAAGRPEETRAPIRMAEAPPRACGCYQESQGGSRTPGCGPQPFQSVQGPCAASGTSYLS